METPAEVYKMNTPPETFIRVPQQAMRGFVSRAARQVGLIEDKADLLAELLTANDLRGVFSHGTRLIATYAPAMRDGLLNASPRVRVVSETPVSLVVDGDGGLGYFAAYEGTLRAIEKAGSGGVALMQSRNHGHVGAAGIYSRMTLGYDLLTFVTCGHQLDLRPGMPVYTPAIGSPMSFSAPAGEEDPLVVDFSPVYDLRVSPHWKEISQWVPGTVFRCIGLGAVAQAWGGVLAGIPLDGARAVRSYSGANQTCLVITFQVGLFIDPEQFRREMDEFVRRVGALAPLEGFERAHLAGGPEAEREREYRVHGIPVGPQHQRELEGLARELRLEVPWR